MQSEGLPKHLSPARTERDGGLGLCTRQRLKPLDLADPRRETRDPRTGGSREGRLNARCVRSGIRSWFPRDCRHPSRGGSACAASQPPPHRRGKDHEERTLVDIHLRRLGEARILAVASTRILQHQAQPLSHVHDVGRAVHRTVDIHEGSQVGRVEVIIRIHAPTIPRDQSPAPGGMQESRATNEGEHPPGSKYTARRESIRRAQLP